VPKRNYSESQHENGQDEHTCKTATTCIRNCDTTQAHTETPNSNETQIASDQLIAHTCSHSG